MKALSALRLAAVFCGLCSGLVAQTRVVVDFTTTNSTPLNLGFAGFTTELLGTGIDYGDTNLQSLVGQLSPGWLLYPAGTSGDAFDWMSGLTSNDWITVIAVKIGPNNTAATLCSNTVNALIGKGPGPRPGWRN